MSGKHTIEALMATALYEPLSETDQAQLDAALQADPKLAAEFDAMKKLIAALPLDTPELTGDLKPLLHEQLTTAIPEHRFRFARLIPAAALSLVIAVMIGSYFLQRTPSEIITPSEMTMATTDTDPQSPFTDIFVQVDTLMSHRKAEQAAKLLAESLARFPEAPSAGLALERLAEVNFHPLRQYETAMIAYATLRSTYADTFSNSPQSINRYDLLTEVAPANFAPLLALDQAREQSGDSFSAVEKVLANQLPGSMMAQQTLLAMRDIVASDLPEGATTVAMLQSMQQRCTEPTAKGQVSCALAQRYWNDEQDINRARLLYQEVIKTAPPQVAQLARETLGRLPE